MGIKKTIYNFLTLVCFIALPVIGSAQQTGQIKGRVSSAQNGESLPACAVYIPNTNFATQTNIDGIFLLEGIPYGEYTLQFKYLGYKDFEKKISLKKKLLKLNVRLQDETHEIAEILVSGGERKGAELLHMKAIEGVTISQGKKSEVISLDEMTGSKATNQARQIYAKVPGLNIWESDGAGLQLSIGGRGLNPSRTSNFNTRQNGYDISADALGYPESYYTPPAEAIEKIQLIRGAASLQFGTQFGGLLNFILKDGPESQGHEFNLRQTVGSFGLSNTFASFGLNKNGWKVYSYLQYKRGNEWRPNSKFDVVAGAINAKKQLSEKTDIGIEYTKMHYLAQQPGGLTDREFRNTPEISNRSRNWFRVDWNLASLSFQHRFSGRTRIKSQFFGLLASREALGVLGNISRADNPEEERDLIAGNFRNWGNETRFLHVYEVNQKPWAFLIGTRYYEGFNLSQQAAADKTDKPHFNFLRSDATNGSSYEFPSRNVSVFSENVIRITNKLSVTPGIRFEYISTNADGRYYQSVTNLTGEIISDATHFETKSNDRYLLLGGIGVNYKHNNKLELYTNFTQNYRSINFTDMQIKNSNFRIDPDLEDETGFNFDLGVRGKIGAVFSYDVSLFTLLYNNRIGSVDKYDENTYIPFRFRTNVSKAVIRGVEAVAQVDWWKLLVNKESAIGVQTFVNGAFTHARYTDSDKSAFQGKEVEYVPPVSFKTGLNIEYADFALSYQYSYTDQQFSDASNSGLDSNGQQIDIPNAIIGIIPSYYVMDLALKYNYKNFGIETGVNNLTDEIYFTRRATGYPGPGIIPSPRRNFYFTLSVKL